MDAIVTAVAVVLIVAGLVLLRIWLAKPVPYDAPWGCMLPRVGRHRAADPQAPPPAARRPPAPVPPPVPKQAPETRTNPAARKAAPPMTEQDAVFFALALAATDDVIGELLADRE